MSKILIVPNEITEFELADGEVEVLILHRDMKRLDIRFAPSLKKIVSLSSDIVFGPRELKAETPVLNRCKKLNEIVVFGDIRFNTMIVTGGTEQVAAWTGVDEIPPVVTIFGSKVRASIPYFYYDLTKPIEDVDSNFIAASPEVREYPIDFFDCFVNSSLENPDEITTEMKRKATV